MKWMISVLVVFALALGVVLAALNRRPEGVAEGPSTLRAEPDTNRRVEAGATRTNDAGAVTFEVTPVDLGITSDTADFTVEMNTHSVELGFDLSKMSVLRTDSGVEIAPSAYRGGSGHHVTGKLVFRAERIAGAKALTLIIRDVAGVDERTFTWELQ